MTKNTTITISPEDASFSGHELVIIPKDPKFLPNDDQIEAGLQFLKVHYSKHILESNKSTHVKFLDCGQHLETAKEINTLLETPIKLFWRHI